MLNPRRNTREMPGRATSSFSICWPARSTTFITDTKSGRRFLVDTGGSSFGSSSNLACLIIADVKRPLLGADFCRQHNLLVDLRGQRLIEADTYLSSPCSVSKTPVNELAPVEVEEIKFRKILHEFPDILRPTFSSADVKHGVRHFVPTTGAPIHARARRLAPDKLAVAKREFLEMEHMGIIRKSNSPWASPLHIVPKPNGGWRPCGDYRRLNHATPLVPILSTTLYWEGFTHLLTIIDRTTRWPELIPMVQTSTTDCAIALIRHWIARFGVPLDMTSDRGPQFTSALWNEVANKLGIQVHRTTAYHPQSNGLVERFHRTLKAALKARLQGPRWTDELPWVLLGLRTVPKEDLDTSSAELVYGEPLTVPGEFVNPNSRLHSSNNLFHSLAERFAPIPTSHHGLSTPSIPPSLKNTRFVFVRRDCHRGPLQRPYDGPYRVITPGPKTFRVMIGRREEVISIDRLKPAHVDLIQPALVAQPRCRGRPHITQNQELFTDRYAPLQSKQETTRSRRHVRLPLRFQ
ncbi:hypothetical protein RRG08_038991 [Elysia crispata]|uniref:Integrase catalytic domain-containing protein n=1 Tax=Elysia crispata TaxID=231223 RepID=A0AAE0Y705_9GAST|nr:hypothetical protein RRG08_038991 [Elysia crispata]